jgi:hypothetical protein
MKDGFRLIVRDEPREKPAKPRSLRGLWIALADAALAAVVLVLFAWWHHGAVIYGGKGILVSPRSGHAYAMTDGFKTADNGGEDGCFDFEGRFRNATPAVSADGATVYYGDDSAEIAMTTYSLSSGLVRVADIYISDISRLATARANDFYGKGQREDPALLSERHDALFSITGDNYSERWGGVIMRNGVLYSREATTDVCVLNWDGTVNMYAPEDFDLARSVDDGAYQIWSCGPILLEYGEVTRAAQRDDSIPLRRAALGYYEPGHYCFVIMEGNVTLVDLALNMQALGCESAYNLYGGRLAEMNFDGQIISTPQEADRECGDIIMITK